MDPSKLITSLIPYAIRPAVKEIEKIWNGDKELEELLGTYCRTEGMLALWEVNRGSPQLEAWFQDLERYLYDTEDLLDDLLLSHTSTTHGDNENPGKMTPFSVKKSLTTPHKIVQLREKMDRVSSLIEKALGTGQGNSKLLLSDPHSRLSDKMPFISGTSRDQDKKAIIEELLQGNCSGVSIVGVDGLGKTALARTIMADEAIKSHFPLIFPVSVSGGFQLTSIVHELSARYSQTSIDAAESRRGDGKFLHDHLGNCKERALIILDDLWSVTDEDWECFECNYLNSRPGWKILITTPCRAVAEKTNSIAYDLGIMTDEDCKKLIMAKGSLSEFERDIEIIASKCEGLPIIANKIGLGLSRKQDMQDKKERIVELKNCNLWELHEFREAFLSLNSRESKLPLHLKRCFSYCSLFPPDHEFNKEDLIQLWEVEGFIKPQEEMRLKTIARKECFDHMLSILHPLKSEDSQQPSYKMLESKYRFAQHLASKAFCRVDDEGTYSSLSSYKNIRHLSLANHQIIDQSLSKRIERCKGLRTFLLLHQNNHKLSISCNFFEKLQSLRLLDLSHTNISTLSNPAFLSKHLRYLDLSYTEVNKLPKQIHHLCALQVLKLKNCPNLRQLPKQLNRLISLTHLHISVKKLGHLPPDMGKLTNLEVLDSFSVGKDEGYKVLELEHMQNLIIVHIFGLDNIRNMAEAREARLIEKAWLKTLVLEWDNAETENAEEVLEGLRPHNHLNVLKVRNYGGKLFPIWLTSPRCQLVSINLDNCPNCEILPALGQLPILKKLVLRSIQKVTSLDDQFCGQGERVFPCLELLEFDDMPQLTNWTGLKVGDMPCLRVLKIFDCPVLFNLPSFRHLSFLMSLEINDCPSLKSIPELPSSLNGKLGKLIITNSSLIEERCRDGKADWPKIKGIPYVEIHATRIQTESYSEDWTNHKDKVSGNEQPCTLAKPVKENNISQVYQDEEVSRSQECRTTLPRMGDETHTSKALKDQNECTQEASQPHNQRKEKHVWFSFLADKSHRNQAKQAAATTIVLKTKVHCVGCANKMKKIIIKYEGVEDVNVDLEKDQITVKGTLDMEAMLPYLNMKFNMKVEIAPPPREDYGTQKKAESGDKKAELAEEKEDKVEKENKMWTPLGSDEYWAPTNSPQLGPSRQVFSDELAEEKEGKVEIENKMGHSETKADENVAHTYYSYTPPYPYMAYPPPQMFSDENPNSCSLM